MPTREIASCLEHLRRLRQCLAIVLDSSVGTHTGAAVWLCVEIERTIEDLQGYLPSPQMIRPEVVTDLTRWPEDFFEALKADGREALLHTTGDSTKATDGFTHGANELNTRAALTREAERLADKDAEALIRAAPKA